MPYIRHLYYEETGRGRPVIFIHCPALSHVYWRPVMNRLAPVCRCIGIDLRGHGRSGLGDAPWTFEDIGRDLTMLADHLGLEQPVLAGYSAGGTIALKAALDHPGRFGGVVAVSSFSQCTSPYMKAKVGLGLWTVRMGLNRFIGPNIIGTNSADQAHMRAMLPMARDTDRQALLSFFRETLRTNFTADLHRIDVPVLIVAGGKDDLMHRFMRILVQELPMASTVIFPGCDHRVPTREPASFADAIADFLDDLADRPEDGQPDEPLLPNWMHPGADQPQLNT